MTKLDKDSVTGILDEFMIGLWESIARVCPICLGGCRPINLNQYFEDHHRTRFDVEYEEILSIWGVPSQVVIASQKPAHIKNTESFEKREKRRPASWRGARGHRT